MATIYRKRDGKEIQCNPEQIDIMTKGRNASCVLKKSDLPKPEVAKTDEELLKEKQEQEAKEKAEQEAAEVEKLRLEQEEKEKAEKAEKEKAEKEAKTKGSNK